MLALSTSATSRARARAGCLHHLSLIPLSLILPPLLSPLQRLSLASCCLTTAAAPAIAGMQVAGAAGTPAGVAAQVGIAAAIASFGAFTTGERRKKGEHGVE